jgi:tetratricopeptide (TPR) repeat protein
MFQILCRCIIVACLVSMQDIAVCIAQDVTVTDDANANTYQLFREGRRYLHAKEYKQAVECFEKYLGLTRSGGISFTQYEFLEDRQYECGVYLALAYAHLGRVEAGQQLLESIFARLYEDEKYALLKELCEKSNTQQHMARTAASWLKKIYDQAGWDRRTLSRYARFQEDAGLYREAIQSWKEYVINHAVGPTDRVKYNSTFSARTQIAVLFHKAGEPDKAIALLRELEENSGKNYQGLNGMAKECLDNEIFLTDALRWIQKIPAKYENSMVLHIQAELLYKTGDYAKAVEVGQHAWELAGSGFAYQRELEKYKAALDK